MVRKFWRRLVFVPAAIVIASPILPFAIPAYVLRAATSSP